MGLDLLNKIYGTEYIGSYHLHPRKGPMEGATHVETYNRKLYYSNERPQFANHSADPYEKFLESRKEETKTQETHSDVQKYKSIIRNI